MVAQRQMSSHGRLALSLLLPFFLAAAGPVAIRPVATTEGVSDDADDPAIWFHRGDPARSLILGINKAPAPRGALATFGLDGRLRETIDGLDRPNNVDVEYGLPLGGTSTDIAVVTERLSGRLRVFAIAPEGLLRDVSPEGGIPVFAGETGEAAELMGIGLYRRPADGAIFAIVSRKSGPRRGYLWQYRLQDDGSGKVEGRKVRELGNFSGSGEIEAIAVDDESGYVYYADEDVGIHKWHADPEHPDADRELALFGRGGFLGDREGIAIYAGVDGEGYILCVDQIAGDSRYRVYRREGAPGDPHDHSEVVKVLAGGADETDGIEVTSASLGSRFPLGLLVAMNSEDRNFLLFRWEDVALSGVPKLSVLDPRPDVDLVAERPGAASSRFGVFVEAPRPATGLPGRPRTGSLTPKRIHGGATLGFQDDGGRQTKPSSCRLDPRLHTRPTTSVPARGSGVMSGWHRTCRDPRWPDKVGLSA